MEEADSVDGLPWLYIGSLAAAENQAWLRACNVQRVLTVAPHLEVRYGDTAHLIVDVADHPSADLLGTLNTSFAFMDAAAAEAATSTASPPALLVHCASGVSRSVGTVVAWLMVKDHLSLADALALARTARPQGDPNPGFMSQLQVLERAGGDLAQALVGWSARATAVADARASERRKLADETHVAVDVLEEALQRARAVGATGAAGGASGTWAAGAAAPQPPLFSVRSALQAMSGRLDTARAGDGLPEDPEAKMVFKAARAKLERLLDLCE